MGGFAGVSRPGRGSVPMGRLRVVPSAGGRRCRNRQLPAGKSSGDAIVHCRAQLTEVSHVCTGHVHLGNTTMSEGTMYNCQDVHVLQALVQEAGEAVGWLLGILRSTPVGGAVAAQAEAAWNATAVMLHDFTTNTAHGPPTGVLAG